MDRSHLTAEQAAKEEERLHQECTFTPDLATQRAAAATAGRIQDFCRGVVLKELFTMQQKLTCKCAVQNGKWNIENGERRMENKSSKAESGKWRMEEEN